MVKFRIKYLTMYSYELYGCVGLIIYLKLICLSLLELLWTWMDNCCGLFSLVLVQGIVICAMA